MADFVITNLKVLVFVLAIVFNGIELSEDLNDLNNWNHIEFLYN